MATTYASGWGASPGQTGWAKNTVTGQTLSMNDPRYQALLNPAPAAAAPAAAAPAANPYAGPPGASTIPGQADAASAYSPTPQAAPNPYTTNQGSQDVVRNSYLDRATQSTMVDRNSADFRQQADAFSAGSERARRAQIADNAERANAMGGGMAGSSAESVADRATNEAAMQQQGSFEADLVGKELINKRQEISDALSSLSGLMTEDQRRALQLQLANMDAELRRLGIASNEKLGMADIALRGELGRGGLDLDRARLGFDIGRTQADLNQQAMLALLRG